MPCSIFLFDNCSVSWVARVADVALPVDMLRGKVQNFSFFLNAENFRQSLSFVRLWSSSLHLSILPVSSGVRSLESLCLQVTDLFPGLRRMQTVLPEHGCLLVSPGNYWQNQRELFDSDPDLFKTIQKHEPKGLHTSATLRGRRHMLGKNTSVVIGTFLFVWSVVQKIHSFFWLNLLFKICFYSILLYSMSSC